MGQDSSTAKVRVRHLPKYVHAYVDQYGRAKFYLRRAGFRKIRLPGLPYSEEFMAAYAAALSQVPKPIGETRTRPGTLRALAVSFYQSAAFVTLAASTRRARRNIIEKLCDQHGDKRVALMRTKDIERLVSDKSNGGRHPQAGNELRKVLRAMMKHARTVGMREDNPALMVEKIKAPTKGHHTWTEEEIEKYQNKFPLGTRERLALDLFLYTGTRKGDMVTLGRQSVRNGLIRVVPEKDREKQELWIPMHSKLKESIEATPSGQMVFLVTSFKKPFSKAGFGNWFRERCDEAELHHCSAHGLRKAQGRRLAEAGCTAHQIMAILGHKSLKEAERYTVAANRTRLAIEGMSKIDGGTAILTGTNIGPEGKV